MLRVLTGPVHSGKTSLLLGLVQRMKEEGFKPGGFLSISRWEDDLCQGYDLYLLREKSRQPFIRRSGGAGWERIGPFFFIPEALEKAKSRLIQEGDARPLIVDEVGPLEIGGKGLWPSFQELLFRKSPMCIVVVRENLLGSFLRLERTAPVEVFHVHEPGTTDRIMKVLETA